jgi:hypothetical protein
VKIEIRQGDKHESGKAEKNHGADPPFAIVVLFHFGTSHWITNAQHGEPFRPAAERRRNKWSWLQVSAAEV